MTRTTKSPKQRAEEALAVAQRRVERLEDKTIRARIELRVAELELEEAVTRRDYLAADPALRDDPDSDETPQEDG